MSHDARAAIRDGLRLLVQDPSAWPPADLTRFRNQLLDHCGSDARPLATLLLRAREHGIVDRLPAGPLEAARWEPVRRGLAYALATEGYLQPPWARWAVDTWAVALGTVSADTAARVARDADRPAAARAVAPGAGAGVVPGSTPPGAARPAAGWGAGVHAATGAGWLAARNSPSGFAGGAGARRARRPVFAAPGILPTWVPHHRANPSPVPLTGPFGLTFDPDRLGMIGFGVLLVLVVLLAWSGVRSAPGTAARTGVRGTPVARSAAPESVSRVARVPAVGPMTAAIGRDLVARGIGGRYLVRAALQDYSPARGCEAVAHAVPWGEEQVEALRHVPGERAFSMPGREGVRGVVDSDGAFETIAATGVREGVAWRFTMRGRFTATGFVARAETTTDVVVRWRRSRTCVVTSELVATRLAPTSGPP